MSTSHDDTRFLRAAIEKARRAQANGNPAFGAVLVHADGTVLGRAGNTEAETGDVTAHAEMNLIRSATQQYAPDMLREATLYASTEPCAMCAGALFWARIGRVVFGLRAERLYEMKGDSDRQLKLACRDIVGHGDHDVKVIGPMLEDEAASVFDG